MASGEESGKFKVVFDNQAETNPRRSIDFHTTMISGGALAVPTGEELKAIPHTGFWAQAGQRLIVFFEADAADTVESEESDCEIPVLLRDKMTQQVVGKRVLKLEAGTGFKPSGSVDVICAAGVPARLASWDAPDGMVYQLDPAGKVRAYLGDDTA